MPIPQLPIQQGSTLPGLLEDTEDLEQEQENEEDVQAIADALDLDDETVESEVIELDDGSVVVNFQEKMGPLQEPEFYENMAEVFEESELNTIAQEYLEYIEVDRESRKQRDKQYEEGLRRTGLGKDAPGGATFDGASKVVHPVMAEACVDFAASSSKELLPPEGIVKANIRGEVDRRKERIADRKVNFLNWQLTEQIPEYRDEMEQLLTQIPLGGSQYLKWRYDSEQKRPVPEWIPIDNILLPYASTNFYTAQRATEVQDITADIYLQRVEDGTYRDIDGFQTVSSSDSPLNDQTRSSQANDKIEGKDVPAENIDGLRRVYEITCYMRLENDPLTSGRRAPYILTIDETTEKVLALRRNWEANDEKFTKLDWIVEYKFIPWRGAYAIGLPHLIGGLSAALTGTLRALLDAAHINNSQTLLKLKGGRIGGQSDRIEPTQVVEIEGAPGVDDVRKLAMPMPFNPPSSVLYNLLGWLTSAAKGVVTTSEEKIADANANTPVGTTQALIEQGAKVFSSIHARLHRSQAKSLSIVSRINHWYLEEMDNQSGEEIEVRDFAVNTDVRPVSDPNIFSETQRVAQTQSLLQMAQSAPPGMFNLRGIYQRVCNQLKIPNVEEILPNPQGANESNPALENVSMTMGRPSAAYPDQDHIAHIKIHLQYANDPAYGGSPVIGPGFAPLCLEHIKQHLTLHYLQSMRNYVAEASGGNDSFKLNEEKPLDQTAQQALAVAAELVSMDSQEQLAPFVQQIQALSQKVQQAKQAQMQQIAQNDPTANVIMQTQMAETKRKAEEATARMQLEAQRDKQQFDIKVAELQRAVMELTTKYQTQSQIDSQKNATTIALADINNASKERVAMIQAHMGLTSDQMALEHEQNQTALAATNEAEKSILQHGIEIEQQQFLHDSAMAQQQAQAASQMEQSDRDHFNTVFQNAQQHRNAMEQQAAAPQPNPTQGQ